MTSDLEEVCESGGRRGEGLEAGAGVQPESLVLGSGPFSSVSACGMKVSTLSSFDLLAENDWICGCLFFFYFDPCSRCFL